MKVFFYARRVTISLVAIIFSANSFAVTSVSKPGPLTIKTALPIAQKFNTFSDYFHFVDMLNPGKGYDKWAEASEKSGVSKNFPLNSFRVEGLKVYIPNLPAPFEFSNDGKTISYKGIGVVFTPGMTPAESLKISEEAWGGFREFKAKSSPHAILKIFAPQEAWADGRSESGMHILEGGGIFVPGLFATLLGDGYGAGVALAAFLGGEVVTVVGAAYLLYGLASFLYFSADRKGDAVKDIKLECTKEGAFKLTKTSMTSREIFSQLTDKEVKQADMALTKLCQNPAAVADFNNSIFLLKKKIIKGNADFFIKSSTTFSSGDVVNPAPALGVH